MRVLFSADWHLGYELGGANRVERLPDQVRQLNRIAAYCQEHAVDVLAVAGDVFEAQDKGRARAAVNAMMRALEAPLARGMRLIAIAGNHDRDYFFETANMWLSAHALDGGERITLRTRPDIVTVEAGGERVNFILMPFPDGNRYALAADEGGAKAQRNELLAQRFIEELATLQERSAEMRLPAVVLAHLTLEGSTVRAHRISARDDVTVPFGALPSFEMTVIGHIHKAERIGGGHVYYVGALDRMDIGERGYEPRVLLADIGPKGVRDVQSLPLDPTPFADVVCGNEDEMEAAHAGIERPDETLVKLVIRAPYGTYVAPLLDRARTLFPRLYGNVEYEWQGAPDFTKDAPDYDANDPQATLRKYLAEQNLDDVEREALVALAEELLREAQAKAAQ